MINSIFKILQGIPLRTKSLVFRYGIPNIFSWEIAVIFGKPETGKPIAAEQTKAVPYMSEIVLVKKDTAWSILNGNDLPLLTISDLDLLVVYQFLQQLE